MRLTKHRGKWAVKLDDGRKLSTGFDHGPATRDAAEQQAREIVARLTAPNNTVGEIMAAYLADRDGRVADHARLKYAWQAAKPTFAALAPDQVDRAACRAYVADRRAAGIGDGTIRKELTTLRAGLRWHDRNSPAIIEAPAMPAPRDRALTRAEFRKLLDACDHDHLRVFLHLAIATGGRKEALLSLTWLQVRWDRNQIFLGTKANGKNRATVPMSKSLRAVLEAAHRRRTRDCEFVVEFNGRGVKSVKKAFAKALARAKIAPCTVHDLRHTAAVWMAEDGHAMAKIAQFLGHTDSRITERVYARFSPGHLSALSESLEV